MARYWCKSCEIFVDDNNVSRRHHEASQKHKSGIQRTINRVHQKNHELFRIRKQDQQSKPRSIIRKPKGEKEEPRIAQEPIIEEPPIISVEVSQWEDVVRSETIEDDQNLPQLTTTQTGQERIYIRKTPKTQKSHASLETIRWNLDEKKSIQLSDSDDEDNEKKPVIAFKKRKIPSKSPTT